MQAQNKGMLIYAIHKSWPQALLTCSGAMHQMPLPGIHAVAMASLRHGVLQHMRRPPAPMYSTMILPLKQAGRDNRRRPDILISLTWSMAGLGPFTPSTRPCRLQ